jgi:hypothetical protein
LLRSEVADNPWEEKTETFLLSRHGMQLSCRAEIRSGDTLICVRLDNGRQIEARVAWTQQKTGGGVEAGLEFAADENFWGLDWNNARELPKP